MTAERIKFGGSDHSLLMTSMCDFRWSFLHGCYSSVTSLGLYFWFAFAADRYFTAGNTVKMSFFGKPCQLTITTLVDHSGNQFNCHEPSDSASPKVSKSEKITSPQESSSSQALSTVDNLGLTFKDMTLTKPSRGESHPQPTAFVQIVQPEDPKVPQFFQVDNRCKINIHFQGEAGKGASKRDCALGLEDVGGLAKQWHMIQEMMELHLKKPHVMEKHGKKGL